MGRADTSLIVSPMKGEQSRAAVQAIENEFQKFEGLVVIEAQRVQDFLQKKGMQTSARPKDLTEIHRRFQALEQQYRNVEDLDQAETKAGDLLSLYRDAFPSMDAFEGAGKTLFLRALIRLALDKKVEAKADMEDMFLLDLEFQNHSISTSLYSPDVISFYERSKKDVMKREQGDLLISTQPKGANIRINGKDFGLSPLSISNLSVGEYWISAQQGDQTQSEKIFLSQGQNEKEIKLLSSLSGQGVSEYFDVVDSGKVEADRNAFLDEMGLSLGADIIVFLSAGEGLVRGQLFDQRSQDLSTIIEAKDPPALIDGLVTQLDEHGYVIRKGEDSSSVSSISEPNLSHVLPPSPEEEVSQNVLPTSSSAKHRTKASRPIWKNPWIWVGAGAVLVGTGVGLALFTDVFSRGPSTTTLTVTVP
ncbi:MAG: PEGA domain-containing protein [Bdellovibrionales bacterium]|nr:PEGA domain-containing protein [Bdellovibrionales bacterium]